MISTVTSWDQGAILVQRLNLQSRGEKSRKLINKITVYILIEAGDANYVIALVKRLKPICQVKTDNVSNSCLDMDFVKND